MKYVPDRTGRFKQRPHYELQELDQQCESIIVDFLRTRYGKVEFPVTTDDLTRLIERDTYDLDLYADLTPWGNDVEGLTEFCRGRKPSVKISKRLSEKATMENRLRTTLTHEYGHVRFHAHLWDMEIVTPTNSWRSDDTNRQICKRDGIIGASAVDWMEWQAGYACGAFLMPRSRVMSIVHRYRSTQSDNDGSKLAGDAANALVAEVKTAFQVSQEAARIRLLKLEVLAEFRVD